MKSISPQIAVNLLRACLEALFSRKLRWDMYSIVLVQNRFPPLPPSNAGDTLQAKGIHKDLADSNGNAMTASHYNQRKQKEKRNMINQIATFSNDIDGNLATVLTTKTNKTGSQSIGLMSQKDFRENDPETGEPRAVKLKNAEAKREFAIFRQTWTGKASGEVSRLVANGYTFDRVRGTKTGRIGFTLCPPKVDSVSKTEEATQKRIREAVAAALAAERAKE